MRGTSLSGIRSALAAAACASFALGLLAACQPSDDAGPALGDTGEPLALASRLLPAAFTGDARYWTERILPTGGVTPYEYFIELGSLPPGLAMAGELLFVDIEGVATLPGRYDFVLEVTDAADSTVEAGFSISVFDPATIDLSGQWEFTMTVTNATGVCEPETGQVATHVLTAEQSGSSPTYGFALSGFHGDPDNRLEGSLDFGVTNVEVGGSYPEDGGTTTSAHYLLVYDENTLIGREEWSWTDGVDSCPHGRADVLAQRIVE